MEARWSFTRVPHNRMRRRTADADVGHRTVKVQGQGINFNLISSKQVLRHIAHTVSHGNSAPLVTTFLVIRIFPSVHPPCRSIALLQAHLVFSYLSFQSSTVRIRFLHHSDSRYNCSFSTTTFLCARIKTKRMWHCDYVTSRHCHDINISSLVLSDSSANSRITHGGKCLD